MRWLRAAGVVLAFAIGLFAACIQFPASDKLFPGRAVRGRVQVRWFRGLCRVLGVSVPLLPVPETAQGRLWAANHVSWLDVVVLGAQTPLTFVAKSEICAWPVVGTLARMTGALFVERGRAMRSGSMVAALSERLRRGETLLLFPEGTTTRGGSVTRFHSSLFQAAVDAGVPVLPVVVSYRGAQAELVPFVGDDAFVPHLWRLLGAGGIEVRLAFASLLTNHTQRESLARQTRDGIRSLLRQGQPSGETGPETVSSETVELRCLAP
jgi:1-acyl-sn-glycerol-3-phosphate acyltransferase